MVVFSLEFEDPQFCAERKANAAGKTEFNFMGDGFSVIIFVLKGVSDGHDFGIA